MPHWKIKYCNIYKAATRNYTVVMVLTCFMITGFIITGCVSHGPIFGESSAALLKRAEQAFINEDYNNSRKIYEQVWETCDLPDDKASARAGLACIDMVEANKPDLFITALAQFLQSIDKDMEGTLNPKLLIRAARQGFLVIKDLQHDSSAKITELSLREKEYKKEQQKMRQQINKLKKQISILEKIEQERQKKRKAQ